MILDQNITQGAPSLFVAQRIKELEDGVDPSIIASNFQAIADGLVSYRVRARTTDLPLGLWVSWPGYAVLMICGSQVVSHATALAAAYVLRIPNNTDGMPQYLWDGSFEYYRIRPFSSSDTVRVIVAGHSLGGALAEGVADWIRDSIKPSVSLLVATFGAPRTGDYRFVGKMAQVPTARWMNDSDPVPLVPPSFAESPGMSIHGIVAGTFYFAQYQHVRGGISLSDTGVPTAQELSPLGVISGSGSMATWIYKLATDSSSTHSMSTYIDRLTLLAALQIPPAHQAVHVAPIEPSRTTNRRENNVAANALVQQIVSAGNSQQNANLVVPPERAFTVTKTEGMWFVLFGGFVVAVGPSRKRAGSMATRGNEFLRRLQRQAAVDIDALAQLFPLYLQAAATPDNGFNPPIALFPQ